MSEDGVAQRVHEEIDTEVMSRVTSRGLGFGDVNDTVESASIFVSEDEEIPPMNFEGLAASLAAPKPPSGLELLLARRERSAITTLSGLQDRKPEPPEVAERGAPAGETQPFDRKILAGHATVFDASPSVIVEADRTQPTSIAPFAIDVPVEVDIDIDVESEADERAATDDRYKTVRIPRVAMFGRVGRRLPGILIGTGMALLAGGIVVLAALRPSPSAAAAAAAMTIPPVEPAPQAPATATAAAPVAEQPRGEPALVPVTGVIALRKPGAMLMVDGERKRVEGGKVVVSCGRHRLGSGRRAQTVLVPCGGTLNH